MNLEKMSMNKNIRTYVLYMCVCNDIRVTSHTYIRLKGEAKAHTCTCRHRERYRGDDELR